jgi:hypothetical protein
METQDALMHCSTQQDMANGCYVSYCCALESNWITLIISKCSYNPQSLKSPVKEQVYTYLSYILVITYMCSANVQAIITSYLTIQNVNLPDPSPVVWECLTLQLSRYSTPKSWWLSSSWLNDIRSQKTWNHNVIAVITLNVASKHYCLLQVLVAALLLFSCAAFEKRFPDLLDCRKYHLRVHNNFYSLTCPKDLVFDHYKEQCILSAVCKLPNIRWFNGTECRLDEPSYYCSSTNRFTYCTHDGLRIMINVLCRNGVECTQGQKVKCFLP